MEPTESTIFVDAVRKALYPDKRHFDPIPGLDVAFKITANVAWQLRHKGWGLVKARPGSENNYNGYTTDVIGCLNGTGYHVDILIGSGEENRATWQPNENPEHMAAIRSRIVPPIDVGDCFAQQPPANGDGNVGDLQAQLNQLKAEFAAFMDKKPVTEGSVIALQSMNAENPKPWLCADGNQGNRVIANRDAVNDWEKFKVKVS